MEWRLLVVSAAEKQLRRMQREDRERVLAVLAQMQQDPFRDDIAYLRGLRTAFRRRVGNWRILFDVSSNERLVVVVAVLRRSSKTY